MSTEFTWDKETQRYRYKDSGKFVSTEAVLNLTQTYIDQQIDRGRSLTQDLIDGNLTTAAWEDAIARTLRSAIVNAYTLGKGGLAQINNRDLGLMGSRVKQEYIYLRNFTHAINRGTLSDAQILSRVNLYYSNLHNVQELGRTEGHREAGFEYERNVLSKSEHCPGCLAESAKGWVALGGISAIGTRDCKANDRCHKQFAKELPETEFLARQWGWTQEKPMKKYRKSAMALALADNYPFGQPSPERLALINRYKPRSLPDFTAQQVITIPMRASHNMLALSGLAWHPNEMEIMGQLLLGKPYLLDHEWWDSDKMIGFFYDSELNYFDDPPEEFLEGEHAEVNEAIADKFGYVELILHACIAADAPVLDDIRFRRKYGVSTGTLTKGIYLCPICDVEFRDSECPHLPPTDWILFLKGIGELSPDEEKMIAPFIVRAGNWYGIETSMVVAPNLPHAQIV